jgi:hypothetical protein
MVKVAGCLLLVTGWSPYYYLSNKYNQETLIRRLKPTAIEINLFCH